MVDWQTMIALSTVAVAGLALLPRLVSLWRADPKSGCGGCGGCSSSHSKINAKVIVGFKDIVDRRK